MNEKQTIAYLKKLCNLTKQDSLCDNEMNITTDMCDTLLNYIEQLKHENEELQKLKAKNLELDSNNRLLAQQLKDARKENQMLRKRVKELENNDSQVKQMMIEI